MKKQGLASPPPRAWTRIDDYIEPLVRRARKRRRLKARTQPEAPRLLLSTLPFVALLAALAVLAVAIMVIAFPGAQPQSRVRPPEHQQGVADKGWFQEAQRQFHH
jgi:hypothetical protein